MSKLKHIFSRDIGDAIERARSDEREKCTNEKNNALERQQQKLEGEWLLKLKEKEGELNSLQLRMRDMVEERKIVDKEKQTIREIALQQRQIASDLVFIATQKHKDDTKILQEFLRIQTAIDNSERKLIGLPDKDKSSTQ